MDQDNKKRAKLTSERSNDNNTNFLQRRESKEESNIPSDNEDERDERDSRRKKSSVAERDDGIDGLKAFLLGIKLPGHPQSTSVNDPSPLLRTLSVEDENPMSAKINVSREQSPVQGQPDPVQKLHLPRRNADTTLSSPEVSGDISRQSSVQGSELPRQEVNKMPFPKENLLLIMMCSCNREKTLQLLQLHSDLPELWQK